MLCGKWLLLLLDFGNKVKGKKSAHIFEEMQFLFPNISDLQAVESAGE